MAAFPSMIIKIESFIIRIEKENIQNLMLWIYCVVKYLFFCFYSLASTVENLSNMRRKENAQQTFEWFWKLLC